MIIRHRGDHFVNIQISQHYVIYLKLMLYQLYRNLKKKKKPFSSSLELASIIHQCLLNLMFIKFKIIQIFYPVLEF